MTGDRSGQVAELEAVLCDSSLDDIVDMVLTAPGPHHYRAAAVDGTVDFERSTSEERPRYTVIASSGRNPLERQSDEPFLGHAVERQQAFPSRIDNAYPHAFDSIAQFFDAPHAPDLLVQHTASHYFGDHLGQHGSLGVTQSRAPFMMSGAGVAVHGTADASTRTVDVAPTIAALLGLPVHPDSVGPTGARRRDGLLAHQDGEPLTELLTGEHADHVVVFLLDGCNANLFADVIDSGEAPNLAALRDAGTALRRGALASAPTATLANHTTALTGAHPGHSGVLHNTWFDRSRAATPDLLAMDQMFWSTNHLNGTTETLFEAVHRTRPDAFTTATFEFCDRGADFSSFALMRNGTPPPFPDRSEMRHLNVELADRETQYNFMSMVDHTSAAHTIEAWRRTAGNPLPTLSWCSFAVTDEAGHLSGPHGPAARAAVIDTDGRIGDVVAAVEAAGVLDRTAFVVLADHGMEQADPDNDASWDGPLADTGIDHVLVDHSFVYLADSAGR